VFFVFFFQAEDGIRDFHVTGVQTCALPISIPDGTPLRYGSPAATGPAPKDPAQRRRPGTPAVSGTGPVEHCPPLPGALATGPYRAASTDESCAPTPARMAGAYAGSSPVDF